MIYGSEKIRRYIFPPVIVPRLFIRLVLCAVCNIPFDESPKKTASAQTPRNRKTVSGLEIDALPIEVYWTKFHLGRRENEWKREGGEETHTLQNTLVVHLDLVNGGSFIRCAFLLEAGVRAEGHRFLYTVRLPSLDQQRLYSWSALKRIEMVVQQREVTFETRIPGRARFAATITLLPPVRIVRFPNFVRGMREIGQKRGRLFQNALLARSSPDLPRCPKTWNDHTTIHPPFSFLYFGGNNSRCS